MTHKLSPSISRKSPELVSPYIHIPDNINSFDFDTCNIDECFILKKLDAATQWLKDAKID